MYQLCGRRHDLSMALSMNKLNLLSKHSQLCAILKRTVDWTWFTFSIIIDFCEQKLLHGCSFTFFFLPRLLLLNQDEKVIFTDQDMNKSWGPIVTPLWIGLHLFFVNSYTLFNVTFTVNVFKVLICNICHFLKKKGHVKLVTVWWKLLAGIKLYLRTSWYAFFTASSILNTSVAALV